MTFQYAFNFIIGVGYSYRSAANFRDYEKLNEVTQFITGFIIPFVIELT